MSYIHFIDLKPEIQAHVKSIAPESFHEKSKKLGVYPAWVQHKVVHPRLGSWWYTDKGDGAWLYDFAQDMAAGSFGSTVANLWITEKLYQQKA